MLVLIGIFDRKNNISLYTLIIAIVYYIVLGSRSIINIIKNIITINDIILINIILSN